MYAHLEGRSGVPVTHQMKMWLYPGHSNLELHNAITQKLATSIVEQNRVNQTHFVEACTRLKSMVSGSLPVIQRFVATRLKQFRYSKTNVSKEAVECQLPHANPTKYWWNLTDASRKLIKAANYYDIKLLKECVAHLPK
jgi:hypothetical protein